MYNFKEIIHNIGINAETNTSKILFVYRPLIKHNNFIMHCVILQNVKNHINCNIEMLT